MREDNLWVFLKLLFCFYYMIPKKMFWALSTYQSVSLHVQSSYLCSHLHRNKMDIPSGFHLLPAHISEFCRGKLLSEQTHFNLKFGDLILENMSKCSRWFVSVSPGYREGAEHSHGCHRDYVSFAWHWLQMHIFESPVKLLVLAFCIRALFPQPSTSHPPGGSTCKDHPSLPLRLSSQGSALSPVDLSHTCDCQKLMYM